MPSRRTLLKTLGTTAGAGVAALSGCTIKMGGRGGGGGGAGGVPNGMGNAPASGGVARGYAYNSPAVTRDQATHVARTAEQLMAGIDAASANSPAVIWVPPDAAINLTGNSSYSRTIEHAVIASSRNTNHAGGIIYTNSNGNESPAYNGGEADGQFELGTNARLTGIRFRGATSNVYDSRWHPGYIPMPPGNRAEREVFYNDTHATGVTLIDGSAMVDNCEVFGWASHAISVDCPRSWNRDRPLPTPRIRNCSIHDNMLTSSGYGVNSICGHPLVSRCYFNAHRHAVAGFGYPDCGYTLSNCYFGPSNSLFITDMHYLGENSQSGTSPSDYDWRYHSGGLMRIIGCKYSATHVIEDANFSGGDPTHVLVVGGIPNEKVVIKNNDFAHPPPGGDGPDPFVQSHNPGRPTGPHGFARFDIQNNRYNVNFNFPIGQG